MKKALKNCDNCGNHTPGRVTVVDDEGCCALCGKDTSGSDEEQFARMRIEAQAELLGDLLEAHGTLSGHVAQSVLAGNILDCARQLVASHDAFAAIRCAR